MVWAQFHRLISGADFFNYKSDMGPCPTYCMFAESREWRPYRVDFESLPFKVERVGAHGYLTYLLYLTKLHKNH
jgi:hypothetical protein